MSRLFALAMCSVVATGSVSCKKENKAKKSDTATDTEPVDTAKTPEPPPEEPKEPEVVSPDSELAEPVLLNVADVKWQDGPPSLPKGWQISVVEGAPPFPADKTFTFLAKFPKNYTIPPHTHLTSERVTVLKGTFNLGHGEVVDKKKTTAVKAGGLVQIPVGHVHFVFTGEETVVQVTGVGPWGIFYVNPKDDPRQPPPEKPDVASRFDAEIGAEAKITQAKDVKFEDAPAGMLPKGAKMAVLEGDPAQNKTFVIRIQVPAKYKFPVHSHGVTDRATVVQGAISFAAGDTWNDKDLKELKAGGVFMAPKDLKHYGVAKSAATFQVFGVGPFDIKWANPDEDPAKAGAPGGGDKPAGDEPAPDEGAKGDEAAPK